MITLLSDSLIIDQLEAVWLTPVRLPTSLKGEPLSNGVAPSSITDKLGIATKPSGVVNSKLSEYGDATSLLINLYFTYILVLAVSIAGYQPSL